MQFGRTLRGVRGRGDYKHWPGKTVTEYDDHLFCLLTMNHHPLHLDAHYAEEHARSSARTSSSATTSTRCCSACRVPDISGKAIANLEVE